MRKLFFALAALIISASAFAQEGEQQLNKKYYDTIRKSIEDDIAQREMRMQKYAERTLANLPIDQKLYDESYISVKARVEDGVSEDGNPELNFVYNISYNCRHLESYTDDYPLAVFSWDSSNSVRAICQLTKTFINENLRDIFANPNDLVTVTVFSTVDGVDLSRVIPYDGAYGNFRYMPVTFNGEKMRISVDSTGIRNNCQLAYIRAQSVRAGLLANIEALKRHETEFQYVTRSYEDTGSQYRRSSIEITVHNPFLQRIKSQTSDMIQDDYVDFNIPKRDVVKENTYVLVIANNHYNNSFLPDVPYADNDGVVVRNYFTRAIGVPERQVKLLTNASKAEIKQEGIHWLTDIAQAVATRNGADGTPQAQADIFIYYAGLGFTDFDGNAYLIPNAVNPDGIKSLNGKAKKGCGKKKGAVVSGTSNYDIALSKKETARFAEQCIAVDSLCSWLRGVDKRTLLPVNTLTVILDASFDGNQRTGEPMVRADKKPSEASAKKSKRKANKNSDAMVLLAAAYDKTAYSFDDQHHGFLTYFLLKEVKLMAQYLDSQTYQDFYESVERKLNKESALQGKWQEIKGFVDGKHAADWQRLTL